MKIKQASSRRYYLHSKVKDFAVVNARAMEVFITKRLYDNLNPTQMKYINSLKKIGYNIQLTMF